MFVFLCFFFVDSSNTSCGIYSLWCASIRYIPWQSTNLISTKNYRWTTCYPLVHLLFAREPSGLRFTLTNELEWEKVQMLRSWFQLPRLAVRSQARLQESSRGITLPSLMHSRRGIPPICPLFPFLLPLLHSGPSNACAINFLSKYSQAGSTAFQRNHTCDAAFRLEYGVGGKPLTQ